MKLFNFISKLFSRRKFAEKMLNEKNFFQYFSMLRQLSIK